MNNQPLHRYFKIWTVALVVVPSLLIMAIYTISQFQMAKQKNLEWMGQRVSSEQQQIEYWVEERKNDVRKISQLSAFKIADDEEMKNTLAVLQQHSKDFDSLSYIDKEGFFRISTLKREIRFTAAANQPYFQAAQAGKDYMSDVVIGRNSGFPIINFASPVYDYSGYFQGVILGSVRTTTLENLLRENRLGQTGEMILLNKDGSMITEPRYANVLFDQGALDRQQSRMKLKLSADALEKVQLGTSGTSTWQDYLGNKVIGAYRFMPEQQWTLIGSMSEAEILDPIYRQLGWMAIATVILLLFILPLATYSTNRMKRPIEWLIQQSKLVADDQYSQVAEPVLGQMPNELAVLCKTFVKMSRKIETSMLLLKENEVKLEGKVCEIQEMNAALEEEIMERQAAQLALQQLNDHLEDKVSERTKQLREMNAALGDQIAQRQVAQEALSQKTEEIRQMAYYDVLTGLPNRAYLYERLGNEMASVSKGGSGAVLFIDLDDLKLVNDTFGHTSGDAVIAKSAERIIEVAGPNAFIGRIGGDEFIVILPGENRREVISQIAEQIVQLASCQQLEALGTCFHTTASVGIAVYPEDGHTVEEICKNADNAMYAAKKAGKNCWRFYEAAMQTESYDKIVLTNSLRYAIDRNELQLYYQPQVNLHTGRIVGFEALLRWNSHEHGGVSPVRFIPLAEQSGLIQSIGIWVLRQAAVFIKRLADSKTDPLHVAVNVSPYQLCADGFIENVQAVIREIGVMPQQIELEITETGLIGSLEEGARRLQTLKGLGFGLSLDDFGTGYSSLTYLQQLPVHTLKIDKAFIDMILLPGTKKAIIKSIIDMAHSLQLTVVAEGVETQEQLAYLSQYGCDRLQGYVISRPVPEEEAIKLLDRYNQTLGS
jgi:diguanylate cyclase (GGDEF)-like protein